MKLRAFSILTAVVLLIAWLCIASNAFEAVGQVLRLVPMFFLGIAGATIANASGVGGGVVFVPAFDYFNSAELYSVTASQIVATSFLIQCYGMTTGSLTWLNKMRASTQDIYPTGVIERDFWRIIIWVLCSCLPVLLATQYGIIPAPEKVLFWFKSLSIGLGIALLISVARSSKESTPKTQLMPFDLIVLLLLGIIGGYATALFSVGVGELVALYLFIRNYPLVTCAASAVIITAVTVIIGFSYHFFYTDVPWLMAVFAIPGAVFGGYVARAFAYYLGSYRLKILAGLWIVSSSCYLLFFH